MVQCNIYFLKTFSESDFRDSRRSKIMPISIREVAARAGVSPATVSRVLNKTAVQIAPETRLRVEAAASELQYHPSAVARALVRRQTDTLGVLLPPVAGLPVRNAFFSALLDGVLEAATERHLNVMIFTGQTGEDTHRSMAPLCDGRCDGLLVFYQPPTGNLLPALLKAQIPCVLVSDWREDTRLPCVDVENRESAQAMTRWLIELGHTRVALLGTGPEDHFMQRRLEGYQAALVDEEIEFDESLLALRLNAADVASVIACVEAFMSKPPAERPTAMMCLSDDIAALCTMALGSCGVSVPQQVSVTGFNNDSNALRSYPALTTMGQPYPALGRCAIDLLLERIAGGPDLPARKLRLPTELVVRDSTAPPPSQK